ncbi:MAG: uracil-DNA glycosylase [Holosporales bacterium]|jgi:DNA polymerase|nr:uracil-DNA glycosylase [Holosporales bacterium]
MNENLRKIDHFLARWYKAFGIDHLFHAVESTETLSKKQEQVEANVLNFSTLDELKNAVFNIDCHLKRTARNTVFSDGNPESKLMIIGEAPGQEEDEQGKPFVGQSGKLLNNMLHSVGLNRSEVYISNILFWRPPGNRSPSPDEILFCMPYVEQHIKLINPKLLLLLGGVAVKSILNTSESISKLRGMKNVYNGITTIATFHPAYLLRSPGQKTAAFKDLVIMKKLLPS